MDEQRRGSKKEEVGPDDSRLGETVDLDFLAAAASAPESVASDVCALRLPKSPPP